MGNAGRRKEQKRVNRRKRLERERNVKHNTPDARYRLDVKIDAKWVIAKHFVKESQVRSHIAEIEELRENGDTRILEGRIILLRNGRELVHIEPFEPVEAVGPSMYDAVKSGPADLPMPTLGDVEKKSH